MLVHLQCAWKRKNLGNVNQQAEGKTHFDRLSSEIDWRYEAQDQDFCWIAFLFSLHRLKAAVALSLTRHQVWGEKNPIYVYLNLDLCLSVKRKEERAWLIILLQTFFRFGLFFL